MLREGMVDLAATLLHEPTAAPAEVARTSSRYGRNGEPLELLLTDLDRCHQMLLGRPTSPEDVRAAALAWAAEVSSHYGHVTCLDPLTGLATLEHLRARLVEVYRGCRGPLSPTLGEHRLLVIEVRPDRPRAGGCHRTELARGVRLMQAADHLRGLLVADEVLCAAGRRRLIVLTTPRTAEEVETLPTALADHPQLGRLVRTCRVLDLPAHPAAALDLVARHSGPDT